MATRPEDRYPSCRALADDVERWAADEPVSIYRAPAPVRLARWARKHRTGVAIGAGLLQTAVVALAVSTVLLGQSRARIDRERGASPRRPGRGPRLSTAFWSTTCSGRPTRSATRPGPTSPCASCSTGPPRSVAASESIAREPGVEGAVRFAIGDAYLELGLYPEAAEQLSRAEDPCMQGGAAGEDVIFAHEPRLWANAMRGDSDPDAVARAFKDSEVRLGREHPETVYAADTWAQLNQREPQRR